PRIKYLLVTVMPGPQLAQAVPHTRAVKARFPHITVVWGGYFPSSHPNVALADSSIDFVVRSQGEHTTLELLDVLENGGSLAGIDGLSYREDDGRRTMDDGPLSSIVLRPSSAQPSIKHN